MGEPDSILMIHVGKISNSYSVKVFPHAIRYTVPLILHFIGPKPHHKDYKLIYSRFLNPRWR